MWKSLAKVVGPLVKKQNCLLVAENILQQQLRTTFILKRRFAPFLTKKGHTQKKLRSRHYIYDFVKNTSSEKQPNIDVILTSYVDGLGNVGDKVSTKAYYAYKNLLLPGLAVYATPENTEKFQNVEVKNVERYSSPNAVKIMEFLSRICLSVVMNKESPWTLQAWHVRASFRKCGYVVPEDAITIPPQIIKGPDMNLEGKEFYITVAINNTEKVNVRCRIHHWSTKIVDRLPYEECFWKTPGELVFPENTQKSNSEPNE